METEVALTGADIAIMLAYLLGVVALGMWISRGIKSSKDFFLAGKSLPWWAVGMSLVVSDIGAKDMVGLAADGYRWGIVMMNYDFIGCAFPLLVAAFLFMPFLWMAGVYTIPEYLGRRYNVQVRTGFAVIWTVFMVGTLGTIFVSAAVMFQCLLGWSFWFSVGVTAVVVAVYTTVGGLKAVVVTDTVSCAVLIVGAALICILGLNRVGGFGGLHETVSSLGWTEHHFDLILPRDHPEYPWPAVLLGLGFVLGPAYWIGNQAIVQRTLGTKSQQQARASYIFCAVIKLFFPVLLVLPGLIALALLHDKLGQPTADWDKNQILPLLVARLLPTGVLGIVMGAFLAGVLSNLDSYVNSASTLVVTDLYRPLAPNRSDQHYLAVGRWLVIVFLLGGVAIAYPVKEWFGSVFEAFQNFLTLFQGPLLALLLLGMLTRFATSTGGLVGMVAGLASSILMHASGMVFGEDYDVPFLWVAWWSFVVALVTTTVVSLFTRPYDRKRLEGLVCWIPVSKEAAE
ncbi:MAG: sodium/solute symporter [Pirellulales bacterium]|nr:sodium/solute symporter [Pirellulales bacterium]